MFADVTGTYASHSLSLYILPRITGAHLLETGGGEGWVSDTRIEAPLFPLPLSLSRSSPFSLSLPLPPRSPPLSLHLPPSPSPYLCLSHLQGISTVRMPRLKSTPTTRTLLTLSRSLLTLSRSLLTYKANCERGGVWRAPELDP